MPDWLGDKDRRVIVTGCHSSFGHAAARQRAGSGTGEQAATLLFTGRSKASYINGAALPVDGGFMSAMAVNI